MRFVESVRAPWRLALVGMLALLRPTPVKVAQHVLFRAGAAGRGAPEFRLAHGDVRDRWRTIEAPLGAFDGDPDVVEAFAIPATAIATTGDSCPIETPSFESYQGYVGPAPAGIDAPAAWRRGVRGQGERFADVEGGWNSAHEDLPGARISHVGGEPIDDTHWRAHGTAVLGEIAAIDNQRGVVGLAPDVEQIFTSSIGGVGVADAIDEAAAALRPGDVLLIELQSGGPRGRWIPVEFFDDVYAAIRAATDRGVVVIEAAGNGGENLDHRAYRGVFTSRDSGAILVGAGGPAVAGYRDRARLDFSNFGARVDVQGWGRKVATLDYGDLQACAGSDRHYTGEFSGTSSASPIVAGAALLLESNARLGGAILAPRELRQRLRDTGSPQTGNTRERIGPRPDLAQLF